MQLKERAESGLKGDNLQKRYFAKVKQVRFFWGLSPKKASKIRGSRVSSENNVFASYRAAV